jgi:GTP-binding protein
LVHLVEPEPVDGSDPLLNYDAIQNELREYNQALVERPELVVLTKAELPKADEMRQALEAHIGRKVMAISAVTGQGLNEFLREVTRMLEERTASAV